MAKQGPEYHLTGGDEKIPCGRNSPRGGDRLRVSRFIELHICAVGTAGGYSTYCRRRNFWRTIGFQLPSSAREYFPPTHVGGNIWAPGK